MEKGKIVEGIKKVKNLKVKLFVAIAFLVLMAVQIGPSMLLADENYATFSWQRMSSQLASNEYYHDGGLFFSVAKLDSTTAYCLDYGLQLPTASGGSVAFLRKGSSIITAALKAGYPNNNYGLNNEDAELATQLAVWSLAKSTSVPDSQKATKIVDMNNLKPTAGNETRVANVKAAAQKIIAAAKAAPYISDPKAYIDPSSAKIVIDTKELIAGPYVVHANGFTVSSIDLSLSKAPKSAYLCDAKGNKITKAKDGDKVYVRFAKTEKGSQFNINATAKGSTYTAKIYGTGNPSDGRQDYIKLTSDPVSLDTSAVVKWESLTGDLVLTKVDQYDNILAGAKFDLQDADGKVVQSGTTDSKGVIKFEGLKPGKYKIVETFAPEGYIKNETVQEVTITADNTQYIKYVNKKKEIGNVEIIKVDQYKQKVAGVKFELRDMNDKKIYEGTTDANGILKFDNLAIGKYKLIETEVPDDYIKRTDEYIFEIKTNNTLKITYENVKKDRGGIEIVKVDQYGNKIPGVTFELRDLTGKVIKSGVTDANGILKFESVDIGKYQLFETAVPDGYILKTDPLDIEVKINQTYKINYVNKKIDKGNIEIIKVDQDGNKIPGVKFELQDMNGNKIAEGTTDGNGTLKFDNLVTGKYRIIETYVPEGYEISTKPYDVEVKTNVTKRIKFTNKRIFGSMQIIKVDDSGNPLAGVKFEILDKDKKVIDTIVTDEKGIAQVHIALPLGTYYYREIEAPENVIFNKDEHEFKITKNGEIIKITVENKLVKGKLKIIKTDENGKPLANVTFQILNENKDVVDTIVTNNEGIAESKELPNGKYFYRETDAPVNVIIDSTEHEFNVTKDNPVIEVKVENKLVKGSLKIVKTDDNNAPLAGVKFEILDKDKNVIETIVTDDKGIAVSKSLPVGKYYYKEIEAPDNVILDGKEYEFKVTENNQVIEKQVVNKRIEGKLVIYKKDKDSKKPIAGVTFQVLNANQEVIGTVVTNENGEARVSGLLKGKYYIKEIDAPTDYIMNTKDVEFEITKDSQTVEKEIFNEHKKLPVTGGFISTDMMIVIAVAVVTIAAYVIFSMMHKRKIETATASTVNGTETTVTSVEATEQATTVEEQTEKEDPKDQE